MIENVTKVILPCGKEVAQAIVLTEFLMRPYPGSSEAIPCSAESASDMERASSQQREYAMLLGAFESLTRPPDEKAEFSGLLVRFQEIVEAGHLPNETTTSVEDARDLLNRFQRFWQPYLDESAAAPPSMNIWRVAELGLGEVRNCRVLKWLLDPNELHCQGVRFLRCLFEEMSEQWIDETDAILVSREAPTPEADSRLDIVIESRSVFACIEVKIQEQEDREQLARYFESARKKLRGRRFIGRLLTTEGKTREHVTEGFTRLLWSDVARALRRFAGQGNAADPLTARSQFIRELASQYADFVALDF